MSTLDKIREKIESIPAANNLEGLPIKEKIYQRYSEKVKDDLLIIIKGPAQTEQDIRQSLTRYLANNWKKIKNTFLSYTATPQRDVTQLCCDIAEYICLMENQSLNATRIPKAPIEVLMPDMSVESIAEDFPDLSAIKRLEFNQREYDDLVAWSGRVGDAKGIGEKVEKRFLRLKELEDARKQQEQVANGSLVKLNNDYLCVPLQYILSTHILSADGVSLIPVAVMLDDVSKRPYYDYQSPLSQKEAEYLLKRSGTVRAFALRQKQAESEEAAEKAKGSVELDKLEKELQQLEFEIQAAKEDEQSRLVNHSTQTFGLHSRQQALEHLKRDKGHLLGHLMALISKLGKNDAYIGLGASDNAGMGAYEAIREFAEYYDTLGFQLKIQETPLENPLAGEIYLTITDYNLEKGTFSIRYQVLDEHHQLQTGDVTADDVVELKNSVIEAFKNKQPITKDQLYEALKDFKGDLLDITIKRGHISVHQEEKSQIPAALKTNIETMLARAQDSDRNRREQTCIGLMRESIQPLVKSNEALLAQIKCKDHTHAQKFKEALAAVEESKTALAALLSQGNNYSGQDKLPLTKSLLDEFGVDYQLKSVNDVIELLNMNEDDSLALVEKAGGSQQIAQVFSNHLDMLSDLFFSLSTIRISRLSTLGQPYLLQQITRDDQVTHLLFGLPDEKVKILFQEFFKLGKGIGYLGTHKDKSHIVEGILNNRALVLAAVKQNGGALRYASDALKGDKEIVLTAVKKNGLALYFASDALKGYMEIVLTAVQQNGMALQYVSDALKGYKEIVLAAVKENATALQYASDALKGDEEIVLAAVKQCGLALLYASDALKGDKKIVLAAAKQEIHALQYASDALKSDREFVLAAAQQTGWAFEYWVFEYASDALKGDKEFILEAVKQRSGVLRYASSALKGDKEFVLAAVKQNSSAFQYASDALKGDIDIALAAVQQNGNALQYASNTLKGDRGVVLAAVQQNGWALEYASDAIKGDKGVVLAAVQQNGKAFRCASKALRGDKEFVLSTVRQNGQVLSYASDAIKGNKDVVLAAVQQDGWALEYASDAIKGNKGVVLAAVQQNGWALSWALGELKGDKEFVLAAVQQNVEAFSCVSGTLKGDKEFVLAAVQQNGDALQYASGALKRDKDVVLAAVKQNDGALEYASDDLKGDKEFVLAAVKQNGRAFRCASKALRGDKEFVLAVVQQNVEAFSYVSDALKGDKEFVLSAVQQNGWALEYASDALKDDKDVVFAAVQKNGRSLRCASNTLKGNQEFVLVAVQQNGWALEYASDALKGDKGITLAAVRQNGWALSCASGALKGDKEIVLAAVRQNGRALRCASNALKGDKEFVLAAVKENGWALKHAPNAFQYDKDIVLAAVRQNSLAVLCVSDGLRGDRDVLSAALKRSGDLTAVNFQDCLLWIQKLMSTSEKNINARESIIRADDVQAFLRLHAELQFILNGGNAPEDKINAFLTYLSDNQDANREILRNIDDQQIEMFFTKGAEFIKNLLPSLAMPAYSMHGFFNAQYNISNSSEAGLNEKRTRVC